ncbi:unconventional myosin-Va [Trichonephila clavipes]|nr:unconventional myosin-Va [Trichonephila clavipes]
MITSYVAQNGSAAERKNIRTCKRNIKGFCSIAAKGVVCWGAIIEEDESSVVSCIKEVTASTVIYRTSLGDCNLLFALSPLPKLRTRPLLTCVTGNAVWLDAETLAEHSGTAFTPWVILPGDYTPEIEAKSVEHVKKLNKGLENKIISLQQKIEEMLREKKNLQIHQVDTKDMNAQVERVKQLEETVRAYDNRVAELVQTVAELRAENENLRSEKEDLRTEKDLLKLEKDEIVEHLNKDNIKLKEDLDRMNEAIKAKEKGAIEILENEKRMLLEEFSAERAAYQKLLKENARLEQRYENLQLEVSRVRGNHQRTPSNVSLGSVRSDVTELASDVHDEDIGYGSIRTKDKDSIHLKLEDVHWDDHSPVSKEESPDSESRASVHSF